jgi:glycosyltransferase involved in cell wall biosynthesis
MGNTNNVVAEIQKSNLFLQGSYFEGFPNVILEANSVGVPVIAFDVPGGTNEIITPWKNGVLVEDGNIESYVENVISALSFKFDKDLIIASTKIYSKEIIINEYQNLLLKYAYNSN